MKRRTFIQLFASVPAVMMAQRAIPAVLGEPQVIKADEVGFWCIAYAGDTPVARVRPQLVNELGGGPKKEISAVFGYYAERIGPPRNGYALTRFQLVRDGQAVAWYPEGIFWCPVVTTLQVRWSIT